MLFKFRGKHDVVERLNACEAERSHSIYTPFSSIHNPRKVECTLGIRSPFFNLCLMRYDHYSSFVL